MSKKCGKCQGTEFTPAGLCKVCKAAANARYLAKRTGGGKAVSKAKHAPAAVVSAEPAASPVLEIQQGYGVKAWIDDPYLMIQQTDDNARVDTLCLSRSELRQLMEKFAGWAA